MTDHSIFKFLEILNGVQFQRKATTTKITPEVWHISMMDVVKRLSPELNFRF